LAEKIYKRKKSFSKTLEEKIGFAENKNCSRQRNNDDFIFSLKSKKSMI
jgi:hypothetical protein